MPSIEKIVLTIVAVVGVAYGLLDLLAPQVAIRWQVRSTQRASGVRRSVGEDFGGFIYRGSADPSNDSAVRRRVRLTGTVLVLVMSVTLASILSIRAS